MPVTIERRIQVGFNDIPSGRNSQVTMELNDESLMLTGDENIVDIDFVVLWRIGNAKDFLFSIRDPEDTIKIVAVDKRGRRDTAYRSAGYGKRLGQD